MALENIVAGAKLAKNTASLIIPAFEQEDLELHAKYIIKDNSIIAEYINRDPKYRTLLRNIVKDVYEKKYRPYLIGSKLIDTWDRFTSLIGGVSDFVPGLGTLISEGEELIELGPKILYSALYAKGTGDYAFLTKAAIFEAASFIPVIGDLIDMTNIYADRARDTFRKRVSEEFLDVVSPGRSKKVQ
jgi:hypothetical protein